MPTYQISAFNGQFQTTVQAPSEQAAEEEAFDELKTQFMDSTKVIQYNVYDVRMNYSGCIISVKARSRGRAEQAAEMYIDRKQQEILDELPHYLHGFIQDMTTTAEVESMHDDGHYALNEDGDFVEGEL